MHGNKAGKGGELTQEETTIITGALDMTLKTAKDAMTPLSKLFSLDINSKLDDKTMELILRRGHSRVPIYSRHPTNIIGIILVKNLIKFLPQDETPIRDLTIRKVPRVHDNLPLYDILKQFQQGHSHMAVVIRSHNEPTGFGDQYCMSIDSSSVNFNKSELETVAPRTVVELGHTLKQHIKKADLDDAGVLNGKSMPDLDEDAVGIITLEDVMEELLQEEILDETDEYVAVHNKLKVNMRAMRRSTSGSPGASHLHWISPLTSPLSSYHHSPLSSSYHHSPILHSPIPPYIKNSPFTPPTLSSSPGNPLQPSPSASAPAPPHGSPSSHKVSRKPYEKLRHGT